MRNPVRAAALRALEKIDESRFTPGMRVTVIENIMERAAWEAVYGRADLAAEWARFLTENAVGKPRQQIEIGVLENPYENLSLEELEKEEKKLLAGGKLGAIDVEVLEEKREEVKTLQAPKAEVGSWDDVFGTA